MGQVRIKISSLQLGRFVTVGYNQAVTFKNEIGTNY